MGRQLIRPVDTPGEKGWGEGMNEYLPWAILIAINTPIYLLLGKLLFDDFQGFLDALYFWFKPDLFSLLDGTYGEDFWAEMKLALYFMACAGLTGTEYTFIVRPLFLGGG